MSFIQNCRQLWQSIKLGFSSRFSAFFRDKSKLLNKSVDWFLLLVLIFNSGYAYSNFNPKLAIILLAFGVIVLLTNWFLSFDFSKYKKEKAEGSFHPSSIFKKFFHLNFTTYVFLIIVFFYCLTFLVTRDTGAIGSYVWNIGAIVFAFALSKKYSFKIFSEKFEDFLLFFSILSLIIYIGIFACGSQVFAPFTFVSSNGIKYGNFIFLNFALFDAPLRNTSIFWEPGLFCVFLIVGLLFELCYREKPRPLYTVVFLLAILSTRSTFGYLISVLVLFAFLNKVFQKKLWVKILLFAFLSGSIAVVCLFYQPIFGFLSNLAPSIFGKLSDNNLSLSTRVYSPYFDFLTFIKHPFVGAGLSTAGDEFLAFVEANPTLLDSQTSTTGKMLASFGIAGLIPTLLLIVSFFFNKKIDKFQAVYYSIIGVAILNTEPQNTIVLSYLLIFYFSELAFDKKPYSLVVDKEKWVLSLFFKNANSGILLKNVSASFAIKGLAMVISLFSLPAYIAFFRDDTVLGVWLTILSVITWILTFDFGLGNGLKNNLIIAIANKDYVKAKKLISSTYFSIGLICLLFLSTGLILIPVLSFSGAFDIASLFGVSSSSLISVKTLVITVCVVYSGMVLELFLKIITSILHALQKQALTSVFTLITNSALLIFAYVARVSGQGNKLIALAIVYFLAVNVPLAITTLFLFKKDPFLKQTQFSFKYIDKSASRVIISLGAKFFLIQICLLVINSSNEILITSFLKNPQLVVLYQKYYKLFYVPITCASLIVGPIWGVVTKAVAERKFAWIKKISRAMNWLSFAIGLLSFIILAVLQPLMDAWLGDSTTSVNYLVGLIFASYSFISVSILFSAAICNGLAALKTQIIGTVIGAAVKIPLFYLLVKMNWLGDLTWVGVVLINCVVLLPVAVMQPIESVLKLKKIEKMAQHENKA